MRCFSLIVSFALVFAAVNCEETEKVEASKEAEEVEDVPEAKDVRQINLIFLPFSIYIHHTN